MKSVSYQQLKAIAQEKGYAWFTDIYDPKVSDTLELAEKSYRNNIIMKITIT